MQRPFHLMAKPTSYQCNLACEYCFYLEKEQGTLKAKQPRRHMDDEVLSSYIRQYIQCSPTQEVEFSWQGGEPTLAGLEFYQRVLDCQQHYADGKIIHNSIQTNGVLINEQWARFLADNGFLVGISVDGPAPLHDLYRKTSAGKSVFDRVLNAITLLKKYRVEFNILTVVNHDTAEAPLEIYLFLTRELGARFVQFIPVVEQRPASLTAGELIHPQTSGDRALTPWSVSGEQYGRFINAIFDYWVRHDVGRVYVQLFDNALAAWAGEKPSLCIMQPTCGYGLVVEQNGDIYSCDHFVFPEHRLGNIKRDRLDQMVYGKKQKQFGMQKALLPPVCQRCEYRFACRGGCPKHRILQVENHWHNHLCAGYKAIFSHMDPYMRYMARQIQLHQPPANVMAVAASLAADWMSAI
ncbi:anaerobic sulfatase maturase [Sodalis sp. dw_96]|uniref:anaerobic sulfatase maturase n=1 Tax=Sodalis sp. dw_96 TaxID=2719794 RepID=UPI001BD2E34C|nr:anaerobic sulfatase maturase [Sodalis sp. dw_96]